MKSFLIFLFSLTFSVVLSQEDSTNVESIHFVDTVYVNHLENTVIMFPIATKKVTVDPGSEDYAGIVKGGSTVYLRALSEGGKPVGMFIRYDDKFYSCTIAYKRYINNKEKYLDFTKANQIPEAINKNRAITVDSDPIETQMMNKHVGFLEGKEKDKYGTIADTNGKLIYKLADIMQDQYFLYIKVRFYNKEKKDYTIEGVEFMYRNTGDDSAYKQEFDKLNKNNVKILAGTSSMFVYVLPKFNITSKWVLDITLREKNGIRKMSVRVAYDLMDRAEFFKI